MTSHPIVPAPRLPSLPPRPGPSAAPAAAPAAPTASALQAAAGRAVRSAVASVAKADKADLLMWVLAIVVSMYVWRFQGLFRIFAVTKVTLLSMCAALLIFANDRHPMRSLKGIDSPMARAALGILALILISTPFSVYRRASFEFLTTDFLLNLTMMVLVAASIRGPRDVDWHIRAFMFGCAVYTLMSMRGSRSDRLSGRGYYDANDLGALLVCAIPLTVYLLRVTPNKLWRLVGTLLLAVFLYAIIKTSSRGAFLGLISVALFVLVAYRTIPVRVRVGVSLAGVLLFAAAGSQEFWERMGTILRPEEDYNFSGKSVSGRGEVWKRGIGYMLSNPVGVGPFAFPWAEGRSDIALERQEQGMGFKWSAAHNSFIQIGAELGVLGLALMLFAIKSGVTGLNRMAKRARSLGEIAGSAQAVQGALIGFCVAGSFVSFAYSSLIYWIFGVAIGILKLEPKVTPVPAEASGRRR
ncbi:MAG: O-antigen ligase family protein [Gemmatimonadetes bacterium]|nr:O-antigen ligase family protein [Gemmatimonadota bacterium]